MTLIPANLRYASTHMWIEVVPDGSAKIGITDYAQQELGDIVFIELPETNRQFTRGQECAVIESTITDSVLFYPLDGEVIDINDVFDENPEMINIDPYGDGWIFIIRPDDPNELDDLIDANAYNELIEA